MGTLNIEYNNGSMIILVLITIIIVMICFYISWLVQGNVCKAKSTQTEYLDALVPVTWSVTDNSHLGIDVPSTNMTKRRLVEEVFYATHNSGNENLADRCMELLKLLPGTSNFRLEPSGFTPFLDACWAGNHRLVEYMLQHGANVESTGNDGDTPFYLATYSYCNKPDGVPFNPALLQALLNFDCSVNRPKMGGLTPLHLAAHMGHFEVARWLLVHRADAEACTTSGQTAADIAEKYGHHNIAEYLTVKYDKVNPRGDLHSMPEVRMHLLLARNQSEPSPAQSGGSNPMPGGSKPTRRSSKRTRGGSNPIPGGSYPIPGGSYPIPGGSNPIPGGSKPIPGGSNPIPGGSKPIPGGSKPTPSPVSRRNGSPDIFLEDLYSSDE